MAQYQKDEVRDRIAAGALKVLARNGYRASSMADIADAAGVSSGNLYRYHGGKKDLYQAVIPDAFVEELGLRLHRRVQSLDGVDDIRTLPADAPFHALSEELLAFCIRNRLRVVVLLGRSQGTRHEGFADALVRDLADRAIAHFQGLQPDLEVPPTTRFALTRIYRHLVDTIVDILVRYGDESRIRQAVAGFSRYHLAGLKALFEEEWEP